MWQDRNRFLIREMKEEKNRMSRKFMDTLLHDKVGCE
jgi:hypothetical protein